MCADTSVNMCTDIHMDPYGLCSNTCECADLAWSANPGIEGILAKLLSCHDSHPRSVSTIEQLADSGLQSADVSVGADSRGHKQARGEQPDWQLSQTVKNTSEEQIPMAASHRSNHDGDVDTFA